MPHTLKRVHSFKDGQLKDYTYNHLQTDKITMTHISFKDGQNHLRVKYSDRHSISKNSETINILYIYKSTVSYSI